MILQSLSLQNFRSYRKSEFRFSPDINLIIGPNAAGKTNLLEAVHLLATAKSFHAQREREMVNWSVEVAHLKGEIENTVLEIVLTRGEVSGEKVMGKKLKINGIAKRQIDFIGNLRAVYFGPGDLQLVTDSPSLRRHWLDMVLEQVNRDYRRANLVYGKALRQRNRVLLGIRNQELGISSLEYWTELLLANGPVITRKREEFIEFLNHREKSKRKIIYDKSLISPQRLAQYSREEVAAGATLVGPHRDDFSFDHNGRNLAIYGSRGEQRLAILWLKLGELEFVTEQCGDPSTGLGRDRPILLLDDIFSELDHKHRHYVLEIIPRQQTIITTTDLHLIEPSYQKKAKMIELR